MPSIPKLPTFELPSLPFELPSLSDLPTIDFSACTRPELPSFEQVAGAARDAAYVGVGLAVMTVERLQAAGAKVAELVTAGVEQARTAASN